MAGMPKKTDGVVLDPFEELKRLQLRTLTALLADDSLMERLVLKGGTAVDLIHGVGDRHSVDLDFSMEDDFTEQERAQLRDKLERLLTEAFKPLGITVLKVKFEPKPKTISEKLNQFWGGYRLEFKLIETKKAQALDFDSEKMNREAMRVGPSQNSKFEVEISRYEYCSDKEPRIIDGFTVQVYRPRLIVCEKLRALCQQMPEYRDVVPNKTGTPRARDFFDIYNVVHRFGIDVNSPEFFEVVRSVFAIKRVPLELLGKIRDVRSFHEADFDQVRSTVSAGTEVQPFDVYFNFVVEIADKLKALGDI